MKLNDTICGETKNTIHFYKRCLYLKLIQFMNCISIRSFSLQVHHTHSNREVTFEIGKRIYFLSRRLFPMPIWWDPFYQLLTFIHFSISFVLDTKTKWASAVVKIRSHIEYCSIHLIALIQRFEQFRHMLPWTINLLVDVLRIVCDRKCVNVYAMGIYFVCKMVICSHNDFLNWKKWFHSGSSSDNKSGSSSFIQTTLLNERMCL